MVDVMLEFMLGPMRNIGDFYFENQMIFNPIIIGAALISILFGKKKKSDEHVKEEKAVS
ncbi:hypothetical protein J4760_06825 [Salinicoccus sp. ID82-1]|uniref:hypothetical protein n=1 Tax=Salinicoccus TaxID=45669 RepID=UPI0016436E04|nr:MULTISPECIES: hypothetical protein [Salinicoccus]MCG1009730.1 hypothetical protein [Salinicoccus sp. ID82-1]